MEQRGLIIIDLQNEHLPTGKLPLTGIEATAHNTARTITDARSRSIPVLHIRHEFANNEAPVFVPGSDGVEIQDTVTPAASEAVIVKNFIDSFRETDLKAQPDAKGVEEVIIVGAMSHMCVDACVRAAADMDYPVTILHDTCATLDLTFGGVNVPTAQVHAAMMTAFEFGYGKAQSTADYFSA